MKQVKIKIQSVSDLITNSSSEIYTLQGIDSYELWKGFREQLLKWGYNPESDDCGVFDFHCFSNENGTVDFGYTIICNVSENIADWLRKTYGEDCIVDIEY